MCGFLYTVLIVLRVVGNIVGKFKSAVVNRKVHSHPGFIVRSPILQLVFLKLSVLNMSSRTSIPGSKFVKCVLKKELKD